MVKFLVSCRACQRPVMLTARISDPELAELREHLRTAHPAMRLMAWIAEVPEANDTA